MTRVVEETPNDNIVNIHHFRRRLEQGKFKYVTYRCGSPSQRAATSNFALLTRNKHCEYGFAYFRNMVDMWCGNEAPSTTRCKLSFSTNHSLFKAVQLAMAANREVHAFEKLSDFLQWAADELNDDPCDYPC